MFSFFLEPQNHAAGLVNREEPSLQAFMGEGENHSPLRVGRREERRCHG